MKLFIVTILAFLGISSTFGILVPLTLPKNFEYGLEEDIVNMIQGWFENGNEALGIPVMDPLGVETFQYAVGGAAEGVEIDLAVDGAIISGMSKFLIHSFNFDLLGLKADASITIPELHIAADHYKLNGKIAQILPLFGEGTVDLTITNITLSAGIGVHTVNGHLAVKDFTFDLELESIHGFIENFLGTTLDDVINDIMNAVGVNIYNTLMGLIGDDVVTSLQETVNAQLASLTFSDLWNIIMGNRMISPKAVANDYVDELLENVRAYVTDNGYDPYALPDQVESFSDDWAGITWHGEVALKNGNLSGLATIHRVGDAFLEVDGTSGTLNLAATIEFFDFSAGYSYVGVEFMDIGIDASAYATIADVKVALKARLVVSSEGKAFEVFIDELNITDPGYVSVDISGLGPLNFLLEGLAFIVGNVFGGLIFDAIEGPIAEAILNALSVVLPPPSLFVM